MRASLAAVEGFRRAVRPPADLPAREWIPENVRLGSWARGPRLSLEDTPWMVAPIDAAESNEKRVIVLRWPTGSGKSTFFEGLIAWIVSEDPGPLQCSHKTDTQSKRWVETRAVEVLKLSDPTREVLAATHRHKKRKFELILPHMFILFGGASIGNLQDVSIQWVLGQEVWEWEEGMLKEAKARTHDRWNAREIYCGQGGVEGGDFAEEDSLCEQMDWAFRCEACGEVVRFLPRGRTEEDDDPCQMFERRMVWDEELAEAEEVDWEAVASTVRLRCDCGHEYEDEVEVRRALTSSMPPSEGYVSLGNKCKPGCISYSLPKIAVWWVPWARSVERYLEAKRKHERGNSKDLKVVVQKDMARHWEERAAVTDFEAADYSRADFYPIEKEGEVAEVPRWPDEVYRFATVDVQKGHFWMSVRAWRTGGGSRLVWEGKVSTIEGVRDTQLRYGVPNWSLAMDARYRPDLVARWRQRFAGKDPRDSWTMLMGEENDRGYPTQVRRLVAGKVQNLTVYRPFSNWVSGRTADGIGYRFMKFSNLRIKDLLAGLISSEEVEFGVMKDHSEDYAKHMKAEVRREVGKGKWRWETSKSHQRNDLWDCECMGLVMACVKGVVVADEVED